MNLVFLDLEFVCYSKNYSFVVQIGAVKTDLNGNVISTFNYFIKPKKISKINRHFWDLTKISKEDVLNGESFECVYEKFETWVDVENIKAVVTWGAEDQRILRNDLNKFKVKDRAIVDKIYDYQDVFMVKNKEIKRLESMLDDCKGKINGSMHNALSDAMALRHIFFDTNEDTVVNLILAKHYCPVKREVDSMNRIFGELLHCGINERLKNEKNEILNQFYSNQMLNKRKWKKFKSRLEIDLMDVYINLYKSYCSDPKKNLKNEIQLLREQILRFNKKFSNDFKSLEALREKVDELI